MEIKIVSLIHYLDYAQDADLIGANSHPKLFINYLTQWLSTYIQTHK